VDALNPDGGKSQLAGGKLPVGAGRRGDWYFDESLDGQPSPLRLDAESAHRDQAPDAVVGRSDRNAAGEEGTRQRRGAEEDICGSIGHTTKVECSSGTKCDEQDIAWALSTFVEVPESIGIDSKGVENDEIDSSRVRVFETGSRRPSHASTDTEFAATEDGSLAFCTSIPSAEASVKVPGPALSAPIGVLDHGSAAVASGLRKEVEDFNGEEAGPAVTNAQPSNFEGDATVSEYSEGITMVATQMRSEEAALRELEATFSRWRRALASLAATPDTPELNAHSTACMDAVAGADRQCCKEGAMSATSTMPTPSGPLSIAEAERCCGAHVRAKADIQLCVAALVEAQVAAFRTGKERGAGPRPVRAAGAEDVEAGLGRVWEVREEWARRVEEAKEDGAWELAAEELLSEMEPWARSTVCPLPL
jgi:hypothetical protein